MLFWDRPTEKKPQSPTPFHLSSDFLTSGGFRGGFRKRGWHFSIRLFAGSGIHKQELGHSCPRIKGDRNVPPPIGSTPAGGRSVKTVPAYFPPRSESLKVAPTRNPLKNRGAVETPRSQINASDSHSFETVRIETSVKCCVFLRNSLRAFFSFIPEFLVILEIYFKIA